MREEGGNEEEEEEEGEEENPRSVSAPRRSRLLDERTSSKRSSGNSTAEVQAQEVSEFRLCVYIMDCCAASHASICFHEGDLCDYGLSVMDDITYGLSVMDDITTNMRRCNGSRSDENITLLDVDAKPGATSQSKRRRQD